MWKLSPIEPALTKGIVASLSISALLVCRAVHRECDSFSLLHSFQAFPPIIFALNIKLAEMTKLKVVMSRYTLAQTTIKFLTNYLKIKSRGKSCSQFSLLICELQQG